MSTDSLCCLTLDLESTAVTYQPLGSSNVLACTSHARPDGARLWLTVAVLTVRVERKFHSLRSHLMGVC